MRNISIKHLDVSNNVFDTVPDPFYCYNTISTMEYVDISNCQMTCITKIFFTQCQWSVKLINASHNNFGSLQGGCNENPSPRDFSTLFEPLTTLETLDLSYNSLSMLDEDFLQTQENLRELRISHNDLTSWRPNMTKWIQLEVLDLSYNNITTLSLETRLELIQLDRNCGNRTTDHISLNLAGNPFDCTCKNLAFLQWLASTHLYLVDMPDYTCIYFGRQDVNSSNMLDLLSHLKWKCTSKVWLICSFIGLLTYFVLVTIVTTCYRWPYFLKYVMLQIQKSRECWKACREYWKTNRECWKACGECWKTNRECWQAKKERWKANRERLKALRKRRKALRKYERFQAEHFKAMRAEERVHTLRERECQYDFDAFISCTRERAKWAKEYLLPNLETRETGFKFCIAQRDFIVGKTIIDNIVDSINSSRKTILLVDKGFIKSKWCQEELLLSHHVSIANQ